MALNVGLVVVAHGRHFIVETSDRQRLLCHRRGKKVDCVVGDRVQWIATGDGGVIEAVLPRRSLLWRQDRWRSKSFAANIDALLVIVAAAPPLAEALLARALIAAAHAGISVQVLLNKIDLPEVGVARARLEPYRRMGVPVLEASLEHDAAAARTLLAPLLAGRATLLLGASGVGKSTLINVLVPDAAAQVGEVSRALNAGRHTTTTTSWYWLDEARTAAVLDSPGFREFGLQQIEAADLARWLPDVAAHATHCRFVNCTHRDEPDCAVRAAAERGEIAASRLRLYEQLHEELSRPRY
ncbi:MAG TPA: ribosome small subunit-dependent GTPase A [Burkholderiaceae bacterium]|nr:ribosome small subunit-dependent GTPase A [Burkholderiaceae bacterium]